MGISSPVPYDAFEDLVREVKCAKANGNSNYPFTIAFSNWVNGFADYSLTIREAKSIQTPIYRCGRCMELSVRSKDGEPILEKVSVVGSGDTKRQAHEVCFQRLIAKLLRLVGKNMTQMDALTDNGEITASQVVDRESNVILEVAAEAESKAIINISSDEINKQLSSTEPLYDMVKDGYSLVNRWYPLQMAKITPATSDIFSLRIPESLYADKTSVNLIPFRGFIYGDLDIEFKLVVNAAQFHAGRLVMGVFYCPQAYSTRVVVPKWYSYSTTGVSDYRYEVLLTEINTAMGMVQRPHVICDLSASTSASLLVKYNYNKPFVRLLDYAKNTEVNPGVLGGCFANLSAKMLTPLRTSDDNPKEVNCTLYYRFVKARLTGMTKQHELTQMDVLDLGLTGAELVSGAVCEGVKMIRQVERQLVRKGKIFSNRDKPSEVFDHKIVIPRPRMHFPNGVGLADPVILGVDTTTSTTHYESPGYGPQSYLELARIPGICQIATWNLSMAARSEIFSQVVVPYSSFDNQRFDPTTGLYSLATKMDPVPLHIATNGFMYWGGTIVYEFDIVKTAFHKGSVMISISYGKEKGSELGSNYEKIVDIQDTSKIKVTVPYIYDTVARRTHNFSYVTAWGQVGNWQQDALPTYSRTKISLIVLNPLIDVGAVANTVDIIVWKYAGPDFFLSTPTQVNNIMALEATTGLNNYDKLPGFPTWEGPSGDPITAQNYAYIAPPATLPPANRTQMDAQDFASGPVNRDRMHSGDETNFKNLLRVPIRIIYNHLVKKEKTFCLPVMPLSAELLHNYLSSTQRLSMTHHYQIPHMFRMWRGSMRYTIMLHTAVASPVFITYIPSDGSFKKKERPKNFNDRLQGLVNWYDTRRIFSSSSDGTGFDYPDLSGTGHPTTIMYHSVNPSEMVEIPWTLPVNWALIDQGNRKSQNCYRDMGYNCNGHICVYCDEDISISVFMSVGDDFELGAFCGLTDYTPSFVRNNKMDDCRLERTQMDFHSCESSSDAEFMPLMVKKVKRVIGKHKYMIKPIALGASTLLPAPYSDVLRHAVIAHTVHDVKTQVTEASRAITKLAAPKNVAAFNNTLGHINGAADKIRDFTHVVQTEITSANQTLEAFSHSVSSSMESLSSVGSNIAESVSEASHSFSGLAEDVCTTLPQVSAAMEGTTRVCAQVAAGLDRIQADVDAGLFSWVKGLFGSIPGLSSVWETIKEVMRAVYEAICASEVAQVAIKMADTLWMLGLTTKEYVCRKMGQIVDLVKKLLGSSSNVTQGPNGPSRDLEMDKGDLQTLLSLLFGGVLTVYGASAGQKWQVGHSSKMASWVDAFALGKGLMTMNGSFLFVRNIYSTLSKMVSHVLGLGDPHIKIRQLLIDNESIVSDFVKNAQLFLNNYNDIALGDVAVKSRFWVTICNAYQIRACFAKMEGNSTMNVLKDLCKEVIKKANENTSLFQSTAVRYEPYVLCFEGQTGIGKSFLTAEISAMTLGNIGLKMNTIDYRYVVNPGVDYWNLYNGQPVIIYDDWCNLVDTQSIRKDISELYQLKTSNVMNAPKAELSEKKTVVNPFVVIMATNNPFPHTNTLVNTDPLYRRRDVVVKVQMVDSNMNRKDPSNFEDYKHLRFGIYDSVMRPQSQFTWMNWDSFKEWLCADHAAYHARESQNVKKRVEILSKALTEQALVHADIADPFTLQARALHQVECESEHQGLVRSLPSEMLEFQVREVIQLIQENYKVVKSGGSTYYIQDATGNSHLTQVPVTQVDGAESWYSYFTTPIISTYCTLKSYIQKWLLLGMRCHVCTHPADRGRVLLTCASCSQTTCGICVKSVDGVAQCVCGGTLTPSTPRVLDYIISYVMSSVINCVAPMSAIETLALSLFKLITSWDLLVPFSVLAALRALLKQRHDFSGPINVTQMKASKRGNGRSNASNQLRQSMNAALSSPRSASPSPPPPIEVDVVVEESPTLPSFSLPPLNPQPEPAFDPDQPAVPPDFVISAVYKVANPEIVECLHHRINLEHPILGIRDGVLHFCLADAVGEIPLGPCNLTTCKWSLLNLSRALNAVFTINRLAYTETHQAIKAGTISDSNYSDVPYVFLPRECRKIVNDSISEATTGTGWWAWIIGKIVPMSLFGAVVYVLSKVTSFCVTSVLSFFGAYTQSETSFDHDKRARKFNNWRRIGRTQGDVTQSADTEMYMKAKEKICSNYVIFTTPNLRAAIGIGLYGSTVLIPKHYIPPLQQASEITVSFYGAKHESFKLNPSNMTIKIFPDKDCALLTLSKAMYFADIRKFFMTDKEFDEYDESRGEIVVPEGDTLVEYEITLLNVVGQYEAYDELTGNTYTTRDAIDYTFQKKGVCGSIVFARNTVHPIIGIHIAGNHGSDKGTGARIRASELSTERAFDMAPLPFELDEICTDFGPDVNIEYLGKLDPSMVPFCPTKSGLTPSLISECFPTPTVTQPAILSNRDARYAHDATPLIHGVRKHGKPTLDFDRDLVLASSQFWSTFLLQKKWGFDHKVQVYSLDQAALGREDVTGYYDWLPDDTSAGWPYNTMMKEVDGVRVMATKKKHWMKFKRDPISDRPVGVEFDPLLLEHYNRDMEYRRQGVLAPIVFQDVLKDEKRKIAKLMKPGGTRVISMSPVTASLALRQYTLDFTSHLRYHRISNWIAVGINPDGPEWGILARRLLSKGDNMFTIDFTNFGPGLNADVAYEFSAMLTRFYELEMGEDYSQEDRLVTRTLIHELVNSIHMAGGTMYRTKAGSPSGAAITVEINSFVHLMYLTICWQIIAKIIKQLKSTGQRPEEVLYRKRYAEVYSYFTALGVKPADYTRMDSSFDEFLSNVVGVVYGDDGLFSVTDAYKQVFNARVIQLVLAAHGIVATDANKGDDTMTTGSIYDMTFLKRSFTPHPLHSGQWAAPIDEDAITECARWIHKSGTEEAMTLTNVQASLLLSYGHGPIFFREWKLELDKYLRQVGLPAIFLSWEDFDRAFYPDYYLQKEDKFELDIVAVQKMLLEI